MVDYVNGRSFNLHNRPCDCGPPPPGRPQENWELNVHFFWLRLYSHKWVYHNCIRELFLVIWQEAYTLNKNWINCDISCSTGCTGNALLRWSILKVLQYLVSKQHRIHYIPVLSGFPAKTSLWESPTGTELLDQRGYKGMSYTIWKLGTCVNQWTYLAMCSAGGPFGKEVKVIDGYPFPFSTFWKQWNVGLINGPFKATTGVCEAHFHLAGKPYVIGTIPSQKYRSIPNTFP